MNPRTTLLHEMDRADLARVVVRLHLTADRRSRTAMLASLGRSKRATLLVLASEASDDALIAAAGLLGIVAGGSREGALAALLEAEAGVSTGQNLVPFVAIDFETADNGRDSACAVALVKVEGGEIADRLTMLLRPPRREFRFTGIHGISWSDVRHAPTFGEAWPAMERFIGGAAHLAAHNAPFDRSVLRACCVAARVEPPTLDFVCTVRAARRVWPLDRFRLPDVCDHLGIPLRHHDAASDAEACARILVAARRAGYRE